MKLFLFMRSGFVNKQGNKNDSNKINLVLETVNLSYNRNQNIQSYN